MPFPLTVHKIQNYKARSNENLYRSKVIHSLKNSLLTLILRRKDGELHALTIAWFVLRRYLAWILATAIMMVLLNFLHNSPHYSLAACPYIKELKRNNRIHIINLNSLNSKIFIHFAKVRWEASSEDASPHFWSSKSLLSSDILLVFGIFNHLAFLNYRSISVYSFIYFYKEYFILWWSLFSKTIIGLSFLMCTT
jgi:hypothetical protein